MKGTNTDQLFKTGFSLMNSESFTFKPYSRAEAQRAADMDKMKKLQLCFDEIEKCANSRHCTEDVKCPLYSYDKDHISYYLSESQQQGFDVTREIVINDTKYGTNEDNLVIENTWR